MALEQLLTNYAGLEEKQSTIFGRIHCARHKENDKIVAIKEDTRSKKSNEPEMHEKLGKHPHIVEYFGSFSDKRHSYIVMEYCEFGSLKQLVDDQGTLPLRCVQFIFKQIVSALEHIHSLQLLYRNLEACHVLLHDVNENGDMFVKLCDFGATRPIQNETRGLLQSSVDFNSLGSLLFFMITGSAFINTPEVYEKLASFNELSADLIKKLLHCDSNFGFNDIKSHQFYTIEFYGEESFCKEDLSELYESLVENDSEGGEEKFESEEENDENTLSFTEKFANESLRKRLNVTEEESQNREIEIPTTPNNTQSELNNSSVSNRNELTQEVFPTNRDTKETINESAIPIQQPLNNLTVDSAYNSASGSPETSQRPQTHRGPENPSLFACFRAVIRALCGYK